MGHAYRVGLLVAVLSVFGSTLVRAQHARHLYLLDTSTMRIDGTSNKSDWSIDVNEMEGELWSTVTAEGLKPDSVRLVVSSADLKSGTSPIMDRLMHRALRSTQYPDIVYTLGKGGVKMNADRDSLRWETSGTLDLAGVNDTLTATVTGLTDSSGAYIFIGSHRMSMREHDITPPTAMFGALHTSEWVDVRFRLVFR